VTGLDLGKKKRYGIGCWWDANAGGRTRGRGKKISQTKYYGLGGGRKKNQKESQIKGKSKRTYPRSMEADWRDYTTKSLSWKGVCTKRMTDTTECIQTSSFF